MTRWKSTFLTLLAVLLSPMAANADLIQFSDRTTFEGAASSLTTETFNAFESDVLLGATGVDVGDFTISSTLDNPILRIESDGTAAYNVDGTAFVRGVGLAGDLFTYTFDTAITAFGVDLFAFNDSIERTRVIIGTSTLFLPVVTGNQFSFFGVVSDTAFTSISFATIVGEDGSFDNISYGTASVPEPGTLALFGIGLLGMGAARRRKKA